MSGKDSSSDEEGFPTSVDVLSDDATIPSPSGSISTISITDEVSEEDTEIFTKAVDQKVFNEISRYYSYNYFYNVTVCFGYTLYNTIVTRFHVIGVILLFIKFQLFGILYLLIYSVTDIILSIFISFYGCYFLFRNVKKMFSSVFEYIVVYENNFKNKLLQWIKIFIIMFILGASFYLQSNRTGILIPTNPEPDVSCSWMIRSNASEATELQNNTHAQNITVTRYYYFAHLFNLFYFESVFQSNEDTSAVHKCEFQISNFFEYYKGFTLGVINLVALVFFRYLYYNDPSRDSYVKNLRTIYRYDVDFPVINISFNNMIKKTTGEILNDVISSLYYLKLRNKKEFDREIDEKVNPNADFSYFKSLNSFEKGFLQYFFIDLIIQQENLIEERIRGEIEAKKQKMKELKDSDSPGAEMEGEITEAPEENFNVWVINKFIFDQFYRTWWTRITRIYSSSAMRSFLLTFFFIFFIFFLVVFIIEIVFVFLRYFLFGSIYVVLNVTFYPSMVILRTIIYSLVFLFLSLIASFLFIFTIFYGDIFEEEFQDMFFYHRYMIEKFNLLKGRNLSEMENMSIKNEKVIRTKNLKRALDLFFEKLWYNMSQGTLNVCATFLGGYMMMIMLIIVILLIIFIGFTATFIIVILVFIGLILFACLYCCCYLPIRFCCFRKKKESNEDAGAESGDNSIKEENLSTENKCSQILNKISQSLCCCSCFCLSFCAPMGFILRIFHWIVDSNRSELFTKVISERVNPNLSKIFQERNKHHLVQEREKIQNAYEIDKFLVQLDASERKSSEKIPNRNHEDKNKVVTELYHKILSFNFRFYLFQQSKKLYDRIEPLETILPIFSDDEEEEALKPPPKKEEILINLNEIKSFQFNLGRFFCKLLFDLEDDHVKTAKTIPPKIPTINIELNEIQIDKSQPNFEETMSSLQDTIEKLEDTFNEDCDPPEAEAEENEESIVGETDQPQKDDIQIHEEENEENQHEKQEVDKDKPSDDKI